MVKQQNIENFINYGYVPFSKSQCIKRILITWGMSFIVSLIGRDNRDWQIAFLCISAFISCVYILLMIRYSTKKFARFICDGVFFEYISLSLCIAAYRIIVIQVGSSWLLFIILVGLMKVCVALCCVMVYSNIVHDKYNEQANHRNSILFPLIGGITGMVAVRLFLHDATQNTIIMFLALMILLLSFITSIGSLNFLKALLVKRIETT